jgi:hypothetical protein
VKKEGAEQTDSVTIVTDFEVVKHGSPRSGPIGPLDVRRLLPLPGDIINRPWHREAAKLPITSVAEQVVAKYQLL